MKLSEQTKKILENYATINDGIVILATEKGETTTPLRICDKHKSVLAQAQIQEVIANDVCIHDLKAFLSSISVLHDPDIILHTDHLVITDQHGSTIKMKYGDPDNITNFQKKMEMPGTIKFQLSEEQLSKIQTLSGILSLPDLKIFSKDGKVFFQVLDRKDESSNTSTLEVGAGDTEGREIYVQRELLKMIPGGYNIEVAEKALLWKSTDHNALEYIIAIAR
jgi:hypothetical protein